MQVCQYASGVDARTVIIDAMTLGNVTVTRLNLVTYWRILYSPGPRKLTYQGISNLGGSQLVYNGELEGVTQAFEQTANTTRPGRQIRIYPSSSGRLPCSLVCQGSHFSTPHSTSPSKTSVSDLTDHIPAALLIGVMQDASSQLIPERWRRVVPCIRHIELVLVH